MSTKPQSQERPRLDFATIGGLILAAGSIVGGLLLDGGKIADVGQVTAALIVLGGTFGAVLISNPHALVFASIRRLGSVLLTRPVPFDGVFSTLIQLAEKARRNGLSSIEDDARETEDPFLRKLLNLAADGIDLREVRHMMELHLSAEEDRAYAEAKVWESAAGYAPTIGIIGAVLGLIQVMKHLDNLEEVGRGIAVAFVATVYGVACANILFLPAAAKLKRSAEDLARLRTMMLEGVVAIAEGLNPRLIALKLDPFVTVKKNQAPVEDRLSAMAPAASPKLANAKAS